MGEGSLEGYVKHRWRGYYLYHKNVRNLNLKIKIGLYVQLFYTFYGSII